MFQSSSIALVAYLIVLAVISVAARRQETETLTVSGYQRLTRYSYIVTTAPFSKVGFLEKIDRYDRVDEYAASCGKACGQFEPCNGIAFTYSTEDPNKNICLMVTDIEAMRDLELWDGSREVSALQVYVKDPADFCDSEGQYFGLSLYLDSHEVVDSLMCRPRLNEGDLCALYTDYTYHNGGCDSQSTCGITDDTGTSQCVKNANTEQISSPRTPSNFGSGQVPGYTLPHPTVLTLKPSDYARSFPIEDLQNTTDYDNSTAYVTACSEECDGRGDCMGIAFKYKNLDSGESTCRLLLDTAELYDFRGCGDDNEATTALQALFKLNYTCNTEGHFYGYLYQGENCEAIIQHYGCQQMVREREICKASDESDAVMVDFSSHNSGCEEGTICQRTEDESEDSPARCMVLATVPSG